MTDSLRVAVIGALGKGKSHAQALRVTRGASLAALVDPAPQAGALAAELDVPLFSDVQAILDAGAADAVLCAVPRPLLRLGGGARLVAGLQLPRDKQLAASPMAATAI